MGRDNFKVKLQARSLKAILKMALHQPAADSDNALKDKTASQARHFENSQNGSSPQTFQELTNLFYIASYSFYTYYL